MVDMFAECMECAGIDCHRMHIAYAGMRIINVIVLFIINSTMHRGRKRLREEVFQVSSKIPGLMGFCQSVLLLTSQ